MKDRYVDIMQRSRESFVEEIENLYEALSESARCIEEYRSVKNYLLQAQEEI